MRCLFTWDYAACGPSADGHVDHDGGRPGDGDDQTLAAAHWEVAVGGSLLKQLSSVFIVLLLISDWLLPSLLSTKISDKTIGYLWYLSENENDK